AATSRSTPRPNIHSATGAQVEPGHVSVLRFRVNDVVVSWIDLRVKSVTAARPEPIGVRDAGTAAAAEATTTASCLARAAPRTVVLQSAANVIRLTHVNRDCIEERRGNRINEFPDRVMIAMRNSWLQRSELLSAIS